MTDFIRVPPSGDGRFSEIHDRRAGTSRSVFVEPFLLAVAPVVQADDSFLPLTGISWYDAVEYCNELSRSAGLEPVYTVRTRPTPELDRRRPPTHVVPDNIDVAWNRRATGYRLPTEAEWELACRAGTDGPRYGELEQIAWYRGNSGERLHRVRSKQPNPWGLHDMLGLVWEWTWDLHDPEVYGSYRVMRGGGWADPEWSCRAGVRRRSHPSLRIDDVGLRLARSL